MGEGVTSSCAEMSRTHAEQCSTCTPGLLSAVQAKHKRSTCHWHKPNMVCKGTLPFGAVLQSWWRVQTDNHVLVHWYMKCVVRHSFGHSSYLLPSIVWVVQCCIPWGNTAQLTHGSAGRLLSGWGELGTKILGTKNGQTGFSFFLNFVLSRDQFGRGGGGVRGAPPPFGF